MIENILELLSLDPYLNVSENIEIAKGKHKLETSFKESWKQFKRRKAWQQKL